MRMGYIIIALLVLSAGVLGVAYTQYAESTTESEVVTRGTSESNTTEERYIRIHNTSSPGEWRKESEVSMKDKPHSETYEITDYPGEEPDWEDIDAAWELYNRSFEAAKERGWFNFDKAKQNGYRKYDSIHYVSENYYFSEENLNPRKPESLIYYKHPENGTRVLVGYMYVMDSIDAEGDQVAGPLTVWHYHPRPHECFSSILYEGEGYESRACPEDEEVVHRTPEMIHVWFVEHPEGPFSSSMGVPPESIASPEKVPESEFKQYIEAGLNESYIE